MSEPVQIGNATLYCGDCRDVLPVLGMVDAVITDPPYGIGFKYASHDDTADGYGDFVWSVVSQCEQLCNEGSPIFVWQAMPNAPFFSAWFPRHWRIFAAAKNFIQMRPCAMQYAFDPVLVWWTDGKAWSKKDASRDFHVANTNPACRKPGAADFVDGHPCPRPLDQVRHIIDQWARPDSVVLDPFMGSGTTGVACAELGRKFIGIEIDRKYFDIACERITKAYAQGDLFIEKPAPKQTEMGDAA